MKLLIIALSSVLYYAWAQNDRVNNAINLYFPKRPSNSSSTISPSQSGSSSEPTVLVSSSTTAPPSGSTTMSLRDFFDNIFTKSPPATQSSTTQSSTTQSSTTQSSTTQSSTTQSSTTQRSTAGSTDVILKAPYTETTPVSENCVCVMFFQCSRQNGTIIANGEGMIDFRSATGDSCGPEQVCCKLPPPEEPSISTPAITRKPPGCGYRIPNEVEERIMGQEGDESTFGEFPWMVAILVQDLGGNSVMQPSYKCGGSLIHPQAVLTAAHCVVGRKKKFIVRAGEWNTQHTMESLPHQDMEAKTVILHPDYYSGQFRNDVALLILKNPFQIAANVDAICLPVQSFNTSNARCYTTGWGTDKFGKKGLTSAILKKVELPIVDSDKCQKRLRKTELGDTFHLHRSAMCAGGEPGKDACKGDGGSPLMCPISGQENRFYQAGIVSWGIGCGKNRIPGIYTNVAMFRNWIDEKILLNKLNASYYQY